MRITAATTPGIRNVKITVMLGNLHPGIPRTPKPVTYLTAEIKHSTVFDILNTDADKKHTMNILCQCNSKKIPI